MSLGSSGFGNIPSIACSAALRSFDCNALAIGDKASSVALLALCDVNSAVRASTVSSSLPILILAGVCVAAAAPDPAAAPWPCPPDAAPCPLPSDPSPAAPSPAPPLSLLPDESQSGA